MKTAISPKDRLFQTAARLFYQHGYRAVGVDTIAAESGIGKMTLYRHYPSKDDLILAFLDDSDQEFWEYFEHSTQAAGSPRAKLLAFFQSLQAYVTGPECYGCPFMNFATEYPDRSHPAHQRSLRHKQKVLERFTQLAQDAGAPDPGQLAGALLLVMDGAYMAARMYGAAPENPAHHAAETARRLIESATRSDPN